MIWCLIFMLFGAFLFAGGIAFERDWICAEDEELIEEENDFVMQKQWENLLGYDGTEQEVNDENF